MTYKIGILGMILFSLCALLGPIGLIIMIIEGTLYTRDGMLLVLISFVAFIYIFSVILNLRVRTEEVGLTSYFCLGIKSIFCFQEKIVRLQWTEVDDVYSLLPWWFPWRTVLI